ncbi:TPA: DEAD/DEAH box helicase [Providencia rettgeri]|uniref:DEAD/DEAH box helicase n=1 Tax=Providencia TaxID=586 RepID=UPI001B9032A8|nr:MULTISPECIES: DEAD/DEAH box helicase [Providencia]EMB5785070.1 DEAD/DEAH box helicase [Providencia rettgeri]MDK7743810.1 DEAD/DEAH box helicase [Providencia rettgeri]MDK7756652.1 DEAD/DEAH box helicase [Providencia rettgeri]QZY62762.1 DEAD/DEAH box helicase [Providencia rettgeri]HBC7429730.1 DEAD/DEAH box helicase [Providencia rettgeri]
MAKTNDIIQAKEHLYMKETSKIPQSNAPDTSENEPPVKTNKDVKFKEVVCPNVPTSYFKRAKKQKIK